MSEELIPPRTKSERRAYLSGYMDAVAEVEKNGLPTAQNWLREMAVMELESIAREKGE